jgi:hypothetical protein
VLTDYIAADGHSGAEGIALKATSCWEYNASGGSGDGTMIMDGMAFRAVTYLQW